MTIWYRPGSDSMWPNPGTVDAATMLAEEG